MNERTWSAVTSDQLTYESLRLLRGLRKRRLYGCACCRRVWHLLSDARSRKAVVLAERFADGLASKSDTKAALVSAKRATRALGQPGVWEGNSAAWWAAAATECVLTQNNVDCCLPAPGRVREAVKREAPDRVGDEAVWQGHALRDIFGNPFRPPVVFAPAWRTDTAVTLARTMYESREFSAMPILADALQDAGCDHPDILNHCRDASQVHVRGCWVCDLVLGKE